MEETVGSLESQEQAHIALSEEMQLSSVLVAVAQSN